MGISEDLMSEIPTDLYEKLRLTPKADLHSHLLLSAPAAAYGCQSNPGKFEGYRGFASYLTSAYFPKLDSIETRLKIIEAAILRWIADGVRLVETSIDVMTILACKDRWPFFEETLTELMMKYNSSLRIRLELGIAREVNLELQEIVAIHLKRGFFQGVDLYGDENAAHAREYIWLFNLARNAGCYCKLHTGEQTDSQRMKEEIKALHPDAIQHGSLANNDQELIELLSNSKIRLNLSPISNIALGYCADYHSHSLAKLLNAGVTLSIASDDYCAFEVGVTEQLTRLVCNQMISAQQAFKICSDSLIETRAQ